MKKVALFAFNPEPMCFLHVLLNALDMRSKGYDVKVVIEGAATRLIPDLPKEGNPMAQLWKKAMAQGLMEGICRACSTKMGTLKAAEEQGLRPLDDMSGHPGFARYIEEGYQILTF